MWLAKNDLPDAKPSRDFALGIGVTVVAVKHAERQGRVGD